MLRVGIVALRRAADVWNFRGIVAEGIFSGVFLDLDRFDGSTTSIPG